MRISTLEEEKRDLLQEAEALNQQLNIQKASESEKDLAIQRLETEIDALKTDAEKAKEDKINFSLDLEDTKVREKFKIKSHGGAEIIFGFV